MRDGTSEWGWSRYPVEPGDEHPRRSEVGDDGEALDSDVAAPVVGLGAICGLRTRHVGDDDQAQSFWISEFALLADGRHVILHEDRGFTIGLGCGDTVQEGLTSEILTHTVLTLVRPDDDSEKPHPWQWLAELARERGLNATAEDLHTLPYQVVFTPSTTRWLQSP